MMPCTPFTQMYAFCRVMIMDLACSRPISMLTVLMPTPRMVTFGEILRCRPGRSRGS
jgi:hypothetical protein